MSRLYSAASDRLTRSGWSQDISTEGTIAILYAPTNAANDGVNHELWRFTNGSEYFYCQKTTGNAWLVDWLKTGRTVFLQTTLGSYSWDTAGWNLYIFRWDGSAIEARWKDASNSFTAGPISDDLAGRWDTSVSTGFTLGNVQAGFDLAFAGRLAWFTIWDKALNTSWLAEAIWGPGAVCNGVKPYLIYPERRVFCSPLEGIFSPEPDWSDYRQSLTVSGPTQGFDPPLQLESHAEFMDAFAAAQVAGDLMPFFNGLIPGFGAGQGI